jgi:dolichol kinase
MLFNILGPLLVVEATLYSVNYDISSQSIIDSIHFPLSIAWLLEFLMEIENGYPRYWGLFYWVMILVMSSLPTYHILSLPSQKISVVVTRKWFHFIAVLLFGPVTLQFPQLMTLAYAIALCVLIVLETLRREIPMLQSFYVTFIDDTKDDGNHIIISHMFLILGCAAPLWISQSVVINNTQQFSSSTLLLAEFGVICIGVGDAMGAVIGKGIGRHKWGKNQRTLEGSLAMWLSMIWLGSYTCHSFEEYRALIVATTFTTILEAFTVQLDNLALPLVGSTIILLNLQQPSC